MTEAHPYTQQPSPYPAPTNGLAVVSLVLSLVGVGLGGIITGHIALRQITQTGEGGRGIALAGTIIGYVATVGAILVVLAYLIFIVAIIGTAGFAGLAANGY